MRGVLDEPTGAPGQGAQPPEDVGPRAFWRRDIGGVGVM